MKGKTTMQGLKVSNQRKASKSSNQTKPTVLACLSRTAQVYAGFSFIPSLLCAPLCLLPALWKVIWQHDAISPVSLFYKFRSNDFSVFQMQMVLNFMRSEEKEHLHFFISWKLSWKCLLGCKFFQCFQYKHWIILWSIENWILQSLILYNCFSFVCIAVVQ